MEAATEPTQTRSPGGHSRWRAWVGATIAVATVVAVGAALAAWNGMLPWDAPMDPGNGGGVVGFHHVPLHKEIPYPALWVYNPSRVGVTLDSVELAAGNLRGLHVIDAWLPSSDRCADLAANPRTTPDECKLPVDGYQLPAATPTGNGPRLVVELEASRVGQYVSPGFVIHYHVGPLHYSTTYTNGLVLCTEGQGCRDSLMRKAAGWKPLPE